MSEPRAGTYSARGDHGGEATPAIQLHIEWCTITTGSDVNLLKRVAELLAEHSSRRRNDDIDASLVFTYALEAVEQAIGDAIAEHEAHMKTRMPSGIKKPSN